MGRTPCCAKEGLNRGAWTAQEDRILFNYIKVHGEGHWRDLPQRAGLNRCGKSCRLRWRNYLNPDIKRGNISGEEEELIIRLHKLLGNRWSLIAGRLPGRTDNEIKNYWNTKLSKKLNRRPTIQSPLQQLNKSQERGFNNDNAHNSDANALASHKVIKTKPSRCTTVFLPRQLDNDYNHKIEQLPLQLDVSSKNPSPLSPDFLINFDIDNVMQWDAIGLEVCHELHQEQKSKGDDAIDNGNGIDGYDGSMIVMSTEFPWNGVDIVDYHDYWSSNNVLPQPIDHSFELNTIASFFDLEKDEWFE